jgi:predicted DCC family thiol-disulfide oxidoreductase YuxK
MRVLVVGATGFIGSRVAKHLHAAGHEVIGTSRHRQAALRAHPEYGWIVADFNRDLDWHVWKPRLHAIDAVVNCAGLKAETRDETYEAVHALGPAALYYACARYGVRKVVHLSVPGRANQMCSHELASRRFAEARLQSLDIDWTVLVHPRLVAAGNVAPHLEEAGPAQGMTSLAAEDLDHAIVCALSAPHARQRITLSGLGGRGADAFRKLTGRPPHAVHEAELVLLYDGGCPVCALEMHKLRERDKQKQLAFVDITALDFNPARYGATLSDMMVRMHAVRSDGALLTGMEAIRATYAAIGLGWLLAPTRWPLIRPLADWGYAQFARNRMRLSRWMGLRCDAACRVA